MMMLVTPMSAVQQVVAMDAPWWTSPAAGLLGTLIGGLITYYTTTVANRHKEEADRERQRVELIRDVSLRFIQAVSKQSVDSIRIQDTSEEFRQLIQKMKEQITQGGDPAELLAALKKAGAKPNDPRSDDPTSRLDMLRSIMEGVGDAQPGISETNVLLAEMRLLLPNHIINIAALVAVVSLFQQMTSALPTGMKLGPGQINAVLNIFTNAVRKEMGLDKYTPPDITLKNMGQRLQDLAENEAQ
jgi:hypothetical protein